MWSGYRTDDLGGIVAGVSKVAGGDAIHAYIARPDGEGPYPGVVLIPHALGWDEILREYSRRFAAHGFITICPNIFDRFGQGTPAEQVTLMRAAGGVSDDSVVGDVEAALGFVKAHPASNGKVGVIGMCSAGRHAVLAASRIDGFDAVADLWGGVVQGNLTANQPVAPIDLTPNLNAPLIGIFGNDDRGPTPAEVDLHEAKLQEHGKTYVFHRYDGAGHGIWYYHDPRYRPQAAMDSWDKVEDWFNQYLR